MLTDLIDRLSRWKIVIGNETSDDSEDDESRPADQAADDGGWDFEEAEPEPKKQQAKKEKKAEPRSSKPAPAKVVAKAAPAPAQGGATPGRPSALTSVVYPVLGRVRLSFQLLRFFSNLH